MNRLVRSLAAFWVTFRDKQAREVDPKMTRPTQPVRNPNKTIWALEDILTSCTEARAAWRIIYQRVRGQAHADPMILAELAALSDQLSTIDTKARDARAGRYTEQIPPSY